MFAQLSLQTMQAYQSGLEFQCVVSVIATIIRAWFVFEIIVYHLHRAELCLLDLKILFINHLEYRRTVEEFVITFFRNYCISKKLLLREFVRSIN